MSQNLNKNIERMMKIFCICVVFSLDNILLEKGIKSKTEVYKKRLKEIII